MGTITPQIAAALALTVYDVQDEFLAKGFVKKYGVFSQKVEDAKHLKAEIGSRIINAKDGFGMCIRGGKGYEDDLFIIFRGSTTANYGADIISDFHLGIETSKTGLPVHIGFNSAFSSMQVEIEEFLDKNSDASGTIHVIGHSLGGAVAAIAAEWLSSRANTIKLYTFGAPKPGLKFFADKLTARVGKHNIHRVYHTTDIVPMIPVFPFAHSPLSHRSYPIPSNSFISFTAHKMVNYIKSVEFSSWESLGGGCEQMTDDHSIERWLKSGVPINPADPKTWEWINASLAWVLRKVIGGAVVSLQAPIVSSLSLADKISWILHRGIDLSLDASGWVLSLMRKIMTALGMRLATNSTELTQLFMRGILTQLIARMSAESRRVVGSLVVQV